MDQAVRALRDGRTDDAPAPLLLLADALPVVGGPALLRRVSVRLLQSISLLELTCS